MSEELSQGIIAKTKQQMTASGAVSILRVLREALPVVNSRLALSGTYRMQGGMAPILGQPTCSCFICSDIEFY